MKISVRWVEGINSIDTLKHFEAVKLVYIEIDELMRG